MSAIEKLFMMLIAEGILDRDYLKDNIEIYLEMEILSEKEALECLSMIDKGVEDVRS